MLVLLRLEVSAYIVRMQSGIACITAFLHISLPSLHDQHCSILLAEFNMSTNNKGIFYPQEKYERNALPNL